MTTYNAIMDAVLARLQTKCGATFKTYSRRLLTWEALVNSRGTPQFPEQPALYLYDGVGFGGGFIQYVQAGRTPSNRQMLRTIVIYAQIPGGGQPQGPDDSTPGGSVFHSLVESVEGALEPDPSDSFATLNFNQMVTHCWIEGEGVIVPGDIDPNGQGMATIPLNILLP